MEIPKNGADMMGDAAYYEAQRPYVWARWLDDAVSHYCEGIPYTVSPTDRADIATDLVNEKVEENGLTIEEGQVYLGYWSRIYGRGVQDETPR